MNNSKTNQTSESFLRKLTTLQLQNLRKSLKDDTLASINAELKRRGEVT